MRYRLNSNDIKNLVYESVMRYLTESPDYEAFRQMAQRAVEKGVSKDVGIKGPLQLERGNVDIHDGKCHLVALSDIMGQYNGIGNEVRPEYEDEMKRIHANYAKSMGSHFPNSVRDYAHIHRMALNRRFAFTNGKSFIFMHDPGTGRGRNGATGYWLVTHISPNDNKDLFILLKELFKYDNIIMAVTEHMWPQLIRMGLLYPEFTDSVPFNGQQVEKMFFTSDKQLMANEVMKKMIAYKQSGQTQINDINDIDTMGQIMKKGLYNYVHGDNNQQKMVSESLVRKIVRETMEHIV